MSDTHDTIKMLKARLLEVEKENELLIEFAELSTEWFWEQDEHCRFTRFFGVSPQKIQRNQELFIGKCRWEMPISGISDEELQAHIDCCAQNKPFHDFEYEVQGDNNQTQHYMVSGNPRFDEDGRFTGYHGVGRNLTELRSVQNEVATSHRQLFQILQGTPTATYVIDKNHTITHWNKACEVLTGVPAKETINGSNTWRGFYTEARKTLADLVVDQASLEVVQQYYSNKLSASKLIEGAYEAEDFFPSMGKNGLWLNFSASPLLDAQGNIIGAIETLKNVTARVIAEQTNQMQYLQLQQTHKELQGTIEQLIEAKRLVGLGQLVAGVAHELNTPLSNALLSLNNSQDSLTELSSSFNSGTLSQKQMREYLSKEDTSNYLMEENLSRCIRLINRFKELSHDQKRNSLSQFHPHTVISEIFKLVNKESQRRNILLTNSVPPALTITQDQGAFEQVIFCLLENSLKHGLQDTGEFSINCYESESSLTFNFSDNGCGLDETMIKHAFDPFFTSKFGQGNSGLGLYRVFNFATSVFGGSVSIHNLDPGLRITLTFPRHKNLST
jgi:PAS domain S-box-containing protein